MDPRNSVTSIDNYQVYNGQKVVDMETRLSSKIDLSGSHFNFGKIVPEIISRKDKKKKNKKHLDKSM